MYVAVTGATGFLGRYIVRFLIGQGHRCRCWHRPESDRDGFEEAGGLDWVEGRLGDRNTARTLVEGTDAVVHAALDRSGKDFRGAEADVVRYAEANVIGTLQLTTAAREAGAGRFVFIATGAVHEVILDDRPLDETHPLWPKSHYGAYKAAVEKFVHSFGLGEGYDICSLRPPGIYGLARPPEASKWYDLVAAVAAGEPVNSDRGAKVVHAADVAKAVGILLRTDGIAGQAYNCCDGYISDAQVAEIAKELTGSDSVITASDKQPKHQIETGKLRSLGMAFGGQPLLEKTVAQLVSHCTGTVS